MSNGLRQSRAGGNPGGSGVRLDARMRGNDVRRIRRALLDFLIFRLLHSPTDSSRRAFLARMSGLLAAPIVLGGCRRNSKKTPVPEQSVGLVETNLDEVEDAASFRPAIPRSEPI